MLNILCIYCYSVEPEVIENVSIVQINSSVLIKWEELPLQSLVDNISVSWVATCESQNEVCVDNERTITSNTISLLGDDFIPGLRYNTEIWVNNVLGSSETKTDVFTLISKTGSYTSFNA